MQHGIYHHEGSRPDEVDLRIRPDIRLPNVFQKDDNKDDNKDEMKVEGMQRDGVSTASLYVAKFMSCRQINVASTF